jgi:hypothetical protein
MHPSRAALVALAAALVLALSRAQPAAAEAVRAFATTTARSLRCTVTCRAVYASNARPISTAKRAVSPAATRRSIAAWSADSTRIARAITSATSRHGSARSAVPRTRSVQPPPTAATRRGAFASNVRWTTTMAARSIQVGPTASSPETAARSAWSTPTARPGSAATKSRGNVCAVETHVIAGQARRVSRPSTFARPAERARPVKPTSRAPPRPSGLRRDPASSSSAPRAAASPR